MATTSTSVTSGKWEIPIGDVYAVYSGDEMLPTKDDMIAYATEMGYTFKDLSAE